MAPSDAQEFWPTPQAHLLDLVHEREVGQARGVQALLLQEPLALLDGHLPTGAPWHTSALSGRRMQIKRIP